MTPAIKHKMIKIIPKVSFLNLMANRKKKAMKIIRIVENRLILDQHPKDRG